MSDSELEEHRGYLSDESRVAAYRAALTEIVRPNDVVLDLGAGTGLLGILACQAGAKTVVAVDRGDIIELARRIAADNGYADRVRYIQSLSTETMLDPPATVVVCDQIGGLVHDAGVLRVFADAKRRLTTPDARFVPARFEIFAAPVAFESGRNNIEFWSTVPAGIDTSAARAHAVNTEWRYNVSASDVERLATGSLLTSFASHHDEPIIASCEVTVDQSGRFDGWLGWFVAEMSPNVRMTNDLWADERINRWCNFLPLDEAVDVEPGDILTLELDVRPRIGTVSWATTAVRDGRQRVRARQSTFNGLFLSRDTLRRHDQDGPIERTPAFELVAAALELVDGNRSQADIVQVLVDRGDSGMRRDALEAFVRRLVRVGNVGA